MFNRMWTSVILIYACFRSTRAYGADIVMYKFEETAPNEEVCGNATELYVNKPFRVHIQHSGPIKEPRCYNYKNIVQGDVMSFSDLHGDGSPGIISAEVIPAQAGTWLYTCTFHVHECYQKMLDICYYHDSNNGSATDPTLSCYVKVIVHEQPKPTEPPPATRPPASNGGAQPRPGPTAHPPQDINRSPRERNFRDPPRNDRAHFPPPNGGSRPPPFIGGNPGLPNHHGGYSVLPQNYGSSPHSPVREWLQVQVNGKLLLRVPSKVYYYYEYRYKHEENVEINIFPSNGQVYCQVAGDRYNNTYKLSSRFKTQSKFINPLKIILYYGQSGIYLNCTLYYQRSDIPNHYALTPLQIKFICTTDYGHKDPDSSYGRPRPSPQPNTSEPTTITSTNKPIVFVTSTEQNTGHINPGTNIARPRPSPQPNTSEPTTITSTNKPIVSVTPNEPNTETQSTFDTTTHTTVPAKSTPIVTTTSEPDLTVTTPNDTGTDKDKGRGDAIWPIVVACVVVVVVLVAAIWATLHYMKRRKASKILQPQQSCQNVYQHNGHAPPDPENAYAIPYGFHHQGQISPIEPPNAVYSEVNQERQLLVIDDEYDYLTLERRLLISDTQATSPQTNTHNGSSGGYANGCVLELKNAPMADLGTPASGLTYANIGDLNLQLKLTPRNPNYVDVLSGEGTYVNAQKFMDSQCL